MHMLCRAVVPVLLLLFGVIEVWWLHRKIAPHHPHAATTLRTSHATLTTATCDDDTERMSKSGDEEGNGEDY